MKMNQEKKNEKKGRKNETKLFSYTNAFFGVK